MGIADDLASVHADLVSKPIALVPTPKFSDEEIEEIMAYAEAALLDEEAEEAENFASEPDTPVSRSKLTRANEAATRAIKTLRIASQIRQSHDLGKILTVPSTKPYCIHSKTAPLTLKRGLHV